MPKSLVYSREDLIKVWRAYEAPIVSNPDVQAILTNEVNLPDILLPNLEPIANVNSGVNPNSSHATGSGVRRRGGAAVGAVPRRSHSDEAPVVKTEEPGEWHVVGDKKAVKDVRTKREPGSWRSKTAQEGLGEEDGKFYDEDASLDDKSRMAKILQGRQSPEGAQKLQWYYVDPSGKRQGPFKTEQMFSWRQTGYLGDELPLAYVIADSALPANPEYTPLSALFPASHGKPFTLPPLGVNKNLWSQ